MNKLFFATITILLCQIIYFPQAYAAGKGAYTGGEITYIGNGWGITGGAICVLGKTYKFGNKESLNITFTSSGQVMAIVTDMEITGGIEIDGENTIQPVRSLPGGFHMYGGSGRHNDFVTYFKLGKIAKIKLKNGDTRTLKSNGFTKAYSQYEKMC